MPAARLRRMVVGFDVYVDLDDDRLRDLVYETLDRMGVGIDDVRIHFMPVPADVDDERVAREA